MKIVTNVTVALLGAALLSAAPGCERQNTAPIGGARDYVEQYPGVSLSDPSLIDALKFQDPIITRNANDLIEVAQPIRADTDEELHIEYKVVWFDDAGVPIEPQTSWTPKRLEPRQLDYIKVAAMSEEATGHNIQIRWSRP